MRQAAVAGTFYPGGREELRKLVGSLLKPAKGGKKAVAGVAPHAGLVYSGKTAAFTWKNVDLTKTIVLVGPDHTGMGAGRTCVYASGEWETPLGQSVVDSGVGKALAKEFTGNAEAHGLEHSLEVQLPFLQSLAPNAKIVPVMMGDQSIEAARGLAAALAKHDVTVVASSDYSHYVPPAKARSDDAYAIEALCALDIDGFYERIQDRGVSACGYGPQACAALFAKAKGAKKGVLLDYSTSPGAQVVGYASIIFV
jgi:hypothetical protein